ncbi:uncharacterized protein AAEQ78_028330 [Lycaon pictus]
MSIPRRFCQPVLVFSSPQNGGSRGVREASIFRRSARFAEEELNSPRADGGGGADCEEAGAQGSWSSPASSTEPARRVGACLPASERPGSRRGGVPGGLGGFPAASAAFSRGVTEGAAAQTAREAISGGL